MVNATAKGTRVEQAMVKVLKELGLDAYRMPLSGNGLGGGDILVRVGGRSKILEVKCRRDGFMQLYTWLKPVDGLIVKADRHEPLLIMRLSDARALLSGVSDPGTVETPQAGDA